MEIVVHNVNGTNIAELVADEAIINTAEDGLDLMGNLYYCPGAGRNQLQG